LNRDFGQRLDDEDMIRLNQAMMAFLGLADSQKLSRKGRE